MMLRYGLKSPRQPLRCGNRLAFRTGRAVGALRTCRLTALAWKAVTRAREV